MKQAKGGKMNIIKNAKFIRNNTPCTISVW